jgi:hypothetical protein
MAKIKKKKQEKRDDPVSRMDDACYSHDPLQQFINRKRYIESGIYYADIKGSERLERRIAEEQA